VTSIEFELRTIVYALIEAVLWKTITVGIDSFGDRMFKDDSFLF
jgi:hypothetical protein